MVHGVRQHAPELIGRRRRRRHHFRARSKETVSIAVPPPWGSGSLSRSVSPQLCLFPSRKPLTLLKTDPKSNLCWLIMSFCFCFYGVGCMNTVKHKPGLQLQYLLQGGSYRNTKLRKSNITFERLSSSRILYSVDVLLSVVYTNIYIYRY